MIDFDTDTRLLTLSRRNGDNDVPVVVNIIESELFAVHRSIGEDRKHLWTVTHVPTLTAITDSCVNRNQAFGIIRSLLDLAWDWNSEDVRYYRNQLLDSPAGVRF